jgi:hypothetical protein
MTWTSTKVALAALGLAPLLLAPGGARDVTGHPLPPGTTVTVAIKDQHHFIKFGLTIDGVPQSVTCTRFSTDGTVGDSPGATLEISPPVVSRCTDSVGGTVLVDTNSRHGSWKLSDKTGATMDLVLPQRGMTMQTAVMRTCEVIAAPAAKAAVRGDYKTKGLDTMTDVSIPVSGKGCTVVSLSVTGSISLSPDPGALPPW